MWDLLAKERDRGGRDGGREEEKDRQTDKLCPQH